MNAGLGALFGLYNNKDALGALLAHFGSQNPYDAGLSGYEGLGDFLTPYKNAGLNALGHAQDNLAFLSSNPQDALMAHYSMSPGAKYNVQQLEQANDRRAAASGNYGSPDELSSLDKGINGIVSQDENQYVQNALNPLMYATSQFGNYAQMPIAPYMDYYGNLASLKANQAAWNNQNQGGIVSDIMNLL